MTRYRDQPVHRAMRRPVQAALTFLLLSAVPVLAQENAPAVRTPEMAIADANAGRDLARKLCVSCHAVEAGASPMQSDIPSFHIIANRPGRTRETLTNWLTLPHPPMPQLDLSRQEIQDLGAYLLSLRESK